MLLWLLAQVKVDPALGQRMATARTANEVSFLAQEQGFKIWVATSALPREIKIRDRDQKNLFL